MSKKSDFLKTLVQQGTAAIKGKIKSGEVKSTDVVIVDDEVASAKKAIGSVSTASIGLTDEDLQSVVMQVSKACGLKTDKDGMGLKDRIELVSFNAQSAATKGLDTRGLFLKGLAVGLIGQAKGDIKKGKLDPSKPYDLKPNAERLINAWRHNRFTGLTMRKFNFTDEELTQMMKGVLMEVGFTEFRE